MLSLIITLTVLSAADQPTPTLAQPVASFERLLTKPWPAVLDGRLAGSYRMARQLPEARVTQFIGHVDARGLEVAARFAHPFHADDAHALERIGCRAQQLQNGHWAAVGTIVAAWCPWSSVAQLVDLPGLVRVSPAPAAPRLPLPPPADTSGADIEIPAVATAHRAMGAGRGITIADIDSGASPFHPFFFRADGPTFDWLDNNGNGVFDLTVDSVDANHDGEYQVGEMLGLLKAPVTAIDGVTGVRRQYNTDGTFVPGVDWLFQDENNDGQRNFGPDAPYGDAKPTFGEQLFVFDDVNGNGRLDLHEKLVALKTPRIAALRNSAGAVFRRGVDLAQYTLAQGDDPGHGSMVLGTMAGGQPGFSKYAGIAPDADLVLASSRESNLVASLAWARDEGASLVLWEMATWYGEFLDGSSELELACDQASAQGQLQVAAAGNLVGARKHRVARHQPGTQTVELVVPASFTNGAFGNFLWRTVEGGQFSFALTLGGQRLPLTAQGGSTSIGNTLVQWWPSTSTRGTVMFTFSITVTTGQLAGETLSFEVTNTGLAADLHGYVTDGTSSWQQGVYWPDTSGASDANTVGTPGVGDHTVTVGTYYASIAATGLQPGDLTHYSSRGPRLDGMDTVDFVAPEDHITAFVSPPNTQGAMWVGAGTSNAAPVATAALAILRALRPELAPDDLVALVKSRAATEPRMGVTPNDTWGAGKLRLFNALEGHAPMTARPPVPMGTARRSGQTLTLDASASTSGEPGALTFRWDLDYDRSFDLEGLLPQVTHAVPSTLGPVVKLEIENSAGLRAAMLVPVVVDDIDAGTPVDAGSNTLAPVSLVNQTPTLGPASGCGCSATSWPGVWLTLAGLGLWVSRLRARR